MIGHEEIDEVVDTLRSDWITTGPKTQCFETAFATYLGSPGALAVNSGTAAMQVALAAIRDAHNEMAPLFRPQDDAEDIG